MFSLVIQYSGNLQYLRTNFSASGLYYKNISEAFTGLKLRNFSSEFEHFGWHFETQILHFKTKILHLKLSNLSLVQILIK
jgi:hypothetical protein